LTRLRCTHAGALPEYYYEDERDPCLSEAGDLHHEKSIVEEEAAVK
jgi:hypothetical protein